METDKTTLFYLYRSDGRFFSWVTSIEDSNGDTDVCDWTEDINEGILLDVDKVSALTHYMLGKDMSLLSDRYSKYGIRAGGGIMSSGINVSTLYVVPVDWYPSIEDFIPDFRKADRLL